jgi:hypothetical protein
MGVKVIKRYDGCNCVPTESHAGDYIKVADLPVEALETAIELVELAAMKERAEAGTSTNSESYKLQCEHRYKVLSGDAASAGGRQWLSA